MTDTAIMRRKLREALEELSDTVDDLVNMLDSFDAAEQETYFVPNTAVNESGSGSESESTPVLAVK
jgi:hypothetical protein